MRIRSKYELNEYLDGELGWRKKELTAMKLLIGRLRQHERRAFLRAVSCILYAHWEGFIKAAATGYVTYVGSRRLAYKELAANFVAIGVRQMIGEAGRSNRASLHTQLTAYLISDLSDRPTFDSDNAINTEANLNSKVLYEILCALGLDDSPYRTKGLLIDARLVALRNRIAHGEYAEIDETEYSELHEEILGLLERFRDDVENAAVLENYRR